MVRRPAGPSRTMRPPHPSRRALRALRRMRRSKFRRASHGFKFQTAKHHRPYSLPAPGTPYSILRPQEGAERRETRGLGASSRAAGEAARHAWRGGGAPLGAPRRRFLAPGSAFPGTRHLRQSQSSRLPVGGVLVPLDRVPRPPRSGVTSPARRCRTRLHLRNVSRRRPQVSRTAIGIY
jgi:hypothetical protein